jgi:hypothetical protein
VKSLKELKIKEERNPMKEQWKKISIILMLSAFVVISACTANTNKNADVIQDQGSGLADCTGVANGDYVPAYDGCNKCLCQGGKAVSCTEKACNPPSVLEQ